VPLVLVLAAAGALLIDVPVARHFRQWRAQAAAHAYADWDPRAYLGFLDTFEPFGHGLGLALVIVLVHQLDPTRRRAIPRVLLCALAAGGAADLLKMMVMRVRPNDFDLTRPVWETFQKWLPLLRHTDSTLQSFPSAHTATAVGLAAALTWLYPQGRYVFGLLAVLVAFQRVVTGAHYPSDVLVGAAAGFFVAMLFLHVGWLPTWFDHWEGRTMENSRYRPTD
jgi:membrane-associated phospholipid phosphatase